jgi:hypothetical protein
MRRRHRHLFYRQPSLERFSRSKRLACSFPRPRDGFRHPNASRFLVPAALIVPDDAKRKLILALKTLLFVFLFVFTPLNRCR